MKTLCTTLATMFILTTMGMAQHSVDLSATASTSTGVTSYNIYRAPCNGTITAGVCSLEGTFVKIGSAATPAYTDSSVTALAKLVYYETSVCATCVPSESIPSNKVAVTIPADGQPLPPTGLTLGKVALNTIQNKSTFVANWGDAPSTETTYLLKGANGSTLAKGTRSSQTGLYTMNWSGKKQRYVVFQVCDVNGCVKQKVS